MLLSHCTHDYTQGGSWYYRISSRLELKSAVDPLYQSSSIYLTVNVLRGQSKPKHIPARHCMRVHDCFAHAFGA